MNVRIFWVCAMECMCAQTRRQFILSSERVFAEWSMHLSRTGMSGSFESMRWNAYVHRLDLGLYSHRKEFLGNGVCTHDRLVGLVVKASASRAEGPRFESRLRRDFFGVESHQ